MNRHEEYTVWEGRFDLDLVEEVRDSLRFTSEARETRSGFQSEGGGNVEECRERLAGCT